MLIDGEADVGIATEALGDYPQLVALPCYPLDPFGDRAAGPSAARRTARRLDALTRFR